MALGTTRTAGKDTSDSDDRLGVAVVNYRMPRLAGAAEAVAHAHRIRQMIEGLKLGLPGMDLVVFPPHGTQGLRVDDEARKAASDVLAVLGRACRNAQAWGLFPVDSAAPAMVLLNAQGDPVQAWRQRAPCAVADGPRGWRLGLVMGPRDEAAAARWIDAERQGAELIVCCPGAADAAAPDQGRAGSMDDLRTRARAHRAYVARAHDTGADQDKDKDARSAIVDFNGEVLAECGDEAYGARHVLLGRRRLHEAREACASLFTSAMRDPRSPPAGLPHGGAQHPGPP